MGCWEGVKGGQPEIKHIPGGLPGRGGSTSPSNSRMAAKASVARVGGVLSKAAGRAQFPKLVLGEPQTLRVFAPIGG